MSLVLQLQRVMMSKYSKVGVDTIHTFRVMDYIKVLNDDNDDALDSDHYSLTFSMK